MSPESRPTHARFPRFPFAGVLALTVLAIGLLTASSVRSLRTIQGLERNELAIERTCGRIAHLDEVLTMSARMGAATGDLAWERRYLEHVPRLDQAISDARRLAPIEEESAGSLQTKEANDALVAMELQAFELVRAGHTLRASELLSGPEYERQKLVYSKGNDRYLASMRARTSDILAAERARAQREKLALAVLLPLMGLLWIRVGTSIAAHVRGRRAAETELRSRAAELERANEEVRSAVQAKSAFLARVSHEIRTPMNGVLSIAELLARTELSTEQAHYVDTIVSSGSQLHSMLNDILDYSKIEAGKLRIAPAPCDLRAIALDVARTLEPRAKAKGIELFGRVASDVPERVLLDPVRVRQILLNLVGNAVKFTERGHVELKVESGAEAGTVVLAVQDTGVGIPEERLADVFESFVQADDSVGRRFGGTGLGLTICRELARAMGGSVDVASRLRAGSTFTVRLPAPAAELADPLVAGGNAATWQAHVLVAEDNAVNQLVARRMLERFGCNVDVVSDGEQCVARLEKRAYDLVLMDLSMPGLDGFAATRALREREKGGPRTPIVAFTASAFPGDVEMCRNADMDGFLPKPLRERELLEVLQRWLPEPPPAALPATRDSATDASTLAS